MFKKITSILSAAVLAGSTAVYTAPSVSAADFKANYAEALQKSLYFYECQQAGPLPEWNRVEWRADSTMIDEIKGGWYDAGDHVKFNLPMAYSASMLAWGLYQYPDGLEKCGEMKNYVNNLEFVLDYLAACDLGDEVVFQVGNGTIDHTWWGPVELYEYGMGDAGTSYEEARQIYKSSKGCSAVFGGMAAALAAGYNALDGRIDESKRQAYLEHAENIFKIADASQSDTVYNDSNASGFYRSNHFYDELFYAANWLYIATGDKAYLEKAKGYIPNLGKELGSDELKYSWEQCWDDTMQGGMLLYAINTGEYVDRVEKHVKNDVYNIKKVDGKLAYFDSWGCARYAQTAAFIVSVACDTVLADKDTSDYKAFAKTQVDYVLGDNPLGQSYVVGYGEKSAHNAHHRTAHASWKNDIYMPVDNRHTLYGALAGGPNEDGSYEDDRNNYINNEVATDYNAGFTAALCKMISEYGGETDPNFPPVEAHDGPEFYVEATMKQGSSSGATVGFKITNHSAWPARVQDNLSFRYYMDLSEVVAAGFKPEDITIRCDRDQATSMYGSKGIKGAEISDPKKYDGNIYYVEVSFPDGRAVLPVSEGMQQCEVILAFVYPNYGNGWDATNDFSNKDILNGKTETTEDGKTIGIVTPYIPTYINGELYYGYEPDGTYADGGMTPSEQPQKTTTTTIKTTTTTTTTTAKVTTTTSDKPTAADDILWGDANCDKAVNLSDSILILQSIAAPDSYGVNGKNESHITKQGELNADVNENGNGLTSLDALSIQKYLIKLIKELPES